MLAITIHGDHFEISKNIDTYTQERFGDLDHFQPDAKSVNVRIAKEGAQIRVRADVTCEHAQDVHAEGQEDTVYDAIRACSDAVRKQLRRQHSKQVRHHEH